MKYTYTLLAPLALFSGKVFAQTSAKDAASKLCENPADCPIKDVNDIFNILKTIVQYAYTIFFILAVLFILIAAFNFLTAKGDSSKVQGAKDQIKWAVVAIIIALISVGAAQIINSFISNPIGS
jgi:steroid 5-alpha reductase family enzyme